MAHTSESSGRLLSPAVSSALAGGLLVGLTTAVIAFAFIGPFRGYGFDFVDTMFIALMGGIFGIVAGAVAGASETGEPEPSHKVLKAKPAKPSTTPVHHVA